MHRALPAALALLAATPALAATHQPSGITIPDEIEGIPAKVGEGTDEKLSAQVKPFAQFYSYAQGPNRIEIMITRPAHPNASVWFKANEWRAATLLAAGKPEFSAASPIFANSEAVNGLIAFAGFSAHYSSAAIATVGFGDWVVNVVSVSKEIDADAQRQRMNDIVGAIRPAGQQTDYPPIYDIEPCGSQAAAGFASASQKAVAQLSPELAAAGSMVALAAAKSAEGVGEGSLTEQPDGYCWGVSESGKTHWFRPRDTTRAVNWISPVDFTGWTVESWKLPPSRAAQTAASIMVANDYERAVVAGFYAVVPNPAIDQAAGLLALTDVGKFLHVVRKERVLVLPQSMAVPESAVIDSAPKMIGR